jgi:hypothetical protein
MTIPDSLRAVTEARAPENYWRPGAGTTRFDIGTPDCLHRSPADLLFFTINALARPRVAGTTFARRQSSTEMTGTSN